MEAIKRAPSKNRGFYVRMKLHHKRPSFFFRHYKWLLWLSLTFYFFSPYLVTKNDNKPSPLKTHLFSSSSRALIEETTSFNGVKIFVYDLPPKYNTAWLANARCSSHLFAAEVAIHHALMKSHARVINPRDADFFFVPVYVSCNFSAVNGFPAIGHARGLIADAVRLVSTEFPFWNRSKGSDHLFVASHDFGSCFHTMESSAIRDGIPGFLKGSIILQTFGVKGNHPCQDVENVVIPPYVSPESVRTTLQRAPTKGRRDIFAFFRGKMEVHPKNISGVFYSKKVRTEIWRKYNGDRRFYLRRQRFSGYQTEIARSVFCLCPLGWAPWSPRLVESIALGCVPVIIADGIRLPFSDTVRWPDISLTVAESDVAKLGSILEHVAATNLSAIQQNLRDPAVSRALLFNSELRYGDATWQILSSLADKLDRSSRRSGVSAQ